MNSYSNLGLQSDHEKPSTVPRSPAMRSPLGYGPVSMLPDRRPPWKEFVFSMGSQSALVVLLLWIGILHPNVLSPPRWTYHAIRLVITTPPVNYNPQPVRPFRVAPVVELKTPSEAPKFALISPRVERPEPLSVP